MGDEIEMAVEQFDSILAVRLRGRLDITRSESFEKEILSKLKESPFHVIINLTHVTYMSSSGIRALLAIYRVAGKQDRKVVLCAVPVPVYKVLDVVEVGQMLQIFDTEAEALVSLQAQA